MRGNGRLPFVALSNFPMLQNVPDEALPTSFQKGEEVKKILKQGFGRCLNLISAVSFLSERIYEEESNKIVLLRTVV